MAKKKNSKQSLVKTVVRKKTKKQGGNRRGYNAVAHKDYFLRAMALPEHAGPFRVPRQGSAARTVLGMDLRYFTLNNDTEGVRGLQMGTHFSLSTTGVISVLTAPAGTPNVPITVTPGVVAGGMQFPQADTIHDANLVSGCLVVSYLGKPLECTGELLIGVAPELKTLEFTFDSLMLYPGSTWISMVDLMNKGPFSIPLRHLSPKSFEFKLPTNFGEDFDTPFIMIRGLPSGQSVKVEWVRNWECRSNPNVLNGANSIPYESTSGSFTQDLSAFQDACADFSHIIEPARQTLTSSITQWMSGMFPSASSATVLALTGTGAAYAASGSRILQQIRGTGGSRPLLPLYR